MRQFGVIFKHCACYVCDFQTHFLYLLQISKGFGMFRCTFPYLGHSSIWPSKAINRLQRNLLLRSNDGSPLRMYSHLSYWSSLLHFSSHIRKISVCCAASRRISAQEILDYSNCGHFNFVQHSQILWSHLKNGPWKPGKNYPSSHKPPTQSIVHQFVHFLEQVHFDWIDSLYFNHLYERLYDPQNLQIWTI